MKKQSKILDVVSGVMRGSAIAGGVVQVALPPVPAIEMQVPATSFDDLTRIHVDVDDTAWDAQELLRSLVLTPTADEEVAPPIIEVDESDIESPTIATESTESSAIEVSSEVIKTVATALLVDWCKDTIKRWRKKDDPRSQRALQTLLRYRDTVDQQKLLQSVLVQIDDTDFVRDVLKSAVTQLINDQTAAPNATQHT